MVNGLVLIITITIGYGPYEILDQLVNQKRGRGNEEVWVVATRAEAHLIKGDCAEAIDLYSQAARHPESTPHTRAAMYEQVQRILKVQPCKELSQKKRCRDIFLV